MSLVARPAGNHPQKPVDDEIDDRATHPSHFDIWSKRFGGFTLDVAAAAHNTKCERYFTREDNGLDQPWAGERVWMNPPYSDIEPWMVKAWEEWPRTRGIVALLPANRTEQTWWQRHIEPRRDRAGSPLTIEFLPGRLRFLKPGQNLVGPNQRPPFGCLLAIWADPAPSAPVPRPVGLFGAGGEW